MTQLYASVALGTAATVMAMTLLLLRINIYSRRAALTLARRWIMTSNSTSFAVLAPLAAIALCSFSAIPALHVPINDRQSTAGAVPSTPAAASADGEALNSLRAYVDKLDDGAKADGDAVQASAAAELPAVDVMVAKLIARLQDQPDDVAGWKMLGWSYLNTNRPDEAVQAYETALKLAPNDTEIEKALQAARSTKSETPSASATQSALHAAAEPSTDLEQDAMVRGMVDRLAARLETSSNDEEGWTQLIRSRMVLGEKDAASTALSKALAAFSNDKAAKDRLVAVAQSLGVAQAPAP